MFLSSASIREAFLSFFTQHGHHVVSGASLVPQLDSSLLFTNAGMVPFKDNFLGLRKATHDPIVSIQPCVRAGGKHNDLEQVGATSRHHTFFEMLGHFSFGHCDKHQAMALAWKFLTQMLQLPPERLYITVLKTDLESADIWIKKIGLSPQQILYCEAEDNFWQMGETGPCGPCSEIFYDHGPQYAGGPPGSSDAHGDRFVEIWNLVFMQYNRDATGQLHDLPDVCIDTGMGLERIAAVLQGVHDNYDIDTFQNLLHALRDLAPQLDLRSQAARVIVDHIRTVCFLMADGVDPAHEGRGYVLRRLIRRAVRFGFQNGLDASFFHQLVRPCCAIMGAYYTALRSCVAHIECTTRAEEIKFQEVLARGWKSVEEAFVHSTNHQLSGQMVFQLYDTYGMPIDLIEDLAKERGFVIQWSELNRAMEAQRIRSQASKHFDVPHVMIPQTIPKTIYTAPSGARHNASDLESVKLPQNSFFSNLLYIMTSDHQPVSSLSVGAQGIVILDRTLFYAESGGQIADTGHLTSSKMGFDFEISDVQKYGSWYVHFGVVRSGIVSATDDVLCSIHASRHWDIRRHHTATHLLHAALRAILGPSVTQKGSWVGPDRLRFDFSWDHALSSEDIVRIEQWVNHAILSNVLCTTSNPMPLDQAVEAEGALAFFSERYEDLVSVVSCGSQDTQDLFSKEVCGGSHAERTGDLGLFVITSQSACSAHVRRIEACSGRAALDGVHEQRTRLSRLTDILRAAPRELEFSTHKLIQERQELKQKCTQLETQLAHQQAQALIHSAHAIGAIRFTSACFKEGDRNTLRGVGDCIKTQWNSGYVFVLVATCSVLVCVSDDLKSRFPATQLLRLITDQAGGQGGGRPDRAEGKIVHTTHIEALVQSVSDWILHQVL